MGWAGLRSHETGRLGIVNDNEVLVEVHSLTIALSGRKKNVSCSLREGEIRALQRVVETFCHLEEIIPTDLRFSTRANLIRCSRIFALFR